MFLVDCHAQGVEGSARKRDAEVAMVTDEPPTKRGKLAAEASRGRQYMPATCVQVDPVENSKQGPKLALTESAETRLVEVLKYNANRNREVDSSDKLMDSSGNLNKTVTSADDNVDMEINKQETKKMPELYYYM